MSKKHVQYLKKKGRDTQAVLKDMKSKYFMSQYYVMKCFLTNYLLVLD